LLEQYNCSSNWPYPFFLPADVAPLAASLDGG
jgi:hypothetical protein